MAISKDKLRIEFLDDVSVGVSQGVITAEKANDIFEGIYADPKLLGHLQLGRKMESYHDMFIGYDLVSKGKTYTSTFKSWKQIHEEDNVKVEFVEKFSIAGMFVYLIATTHLEDEEDLYRKDNKDYYMIISKR
ncbi:hypothetical protein ACQR3P_31785 [Rhodococcus sp. IEGM1300]